MSTAKRPVSRVRRIAVFVVVAAVSVGIVVAVHGARPTGTVERVQPDSLGQPVSILSVAPSSHVARVTALGEATSIHRLDITAMVDGRVEYVHPDLQSGSAITSGEVLLRVDQSRYAAELASAQSAMALAELALITAQRETDDAVRGWERSGRSLEEASEFVLRLPQLRVAQADHVAAEAQVELAERLLGYTTVTMPFDGIALSGGPAPETNIVAGTTIARVASTDALEIAIALDTAQWSLLRPALQGQQVQLTDAGNGGTWFGAVSRVGRHIDEATRRRVLYVRVERPLDLDPPLFPGTFVTVAIAGRGIDDALRISESALTSAGLVWFVDANDRVQSVNASALFHLDGDVVIAAPADGDGLASSKGAFNVATAPNNSFVNGMAVHPIDDGGTQ